MAGSALLWGGGHYKFGNADQNSLPNQSGIGNELIQQGNDGIADENGSIQKRRGRPPYNVDVLVNENGLDLIMKHCKDWKFKGKGHERSNLKRLIKKYEEWAFIMYPSMRFEDIVKKTLTFSAKNRVKGHLQMLRDKRDGVHVIIGDEMEDEDDDVVMNHPDIYDMPQIQPGDPMSQQQNQVLNEDNMGNESNDDKNNKNSNNLSNEVNNNVNNGGVNNNVNPNGNCNNGSSNFWGDIDPMDMDFGAPPDNHGHEQDDIARAMYDCNNNNNNSNNPEKRRAPRRTLSQLSQTTRLRVARAKTQRLYMINAKIIGEYEREYAVLGSTGNVYTITIGTLHNCTCPDFAKGHLCKHVMFIMLKVLRVHSDSEYVYQEALLTAELAEVFSSAPRTLFGTVMASASVRNEYKKSMEVKTVERKALDGGDCPVCMEEFDGKEATTYCRAQCGNNVHAQCFREWRGSQERSGEALSCMFCRAQWVDGEEDGVRKKASRGSHNEVYMNLADEQGMSRVRDTSSYYANRNF